MSRVIKFRAWDKLDSKMYYDVGLSLIGVQVYANPESYLPEEIVLDRGRDCFEIMQFTGLLDKNGKEIYEGDIVRFIYSSTLQEERTGIVSWDGEYYSWLFGGLLIEPTPRATMEVIGNIYENPESLKS